MNPPTHTVAPMVMQLLSILKPYDPAGHSPSERGMDLWR